MVPELGAKLAKSQASEDNPPSCSGAEAECSWRGVSATSPQLIPTLANPQGFHPLPSPCPPLQEGVLCIPG